MTTMEPESINWTIAVITIVFGGGGLAAILKVRLDHKKAPLDREAALSAVAQQNVDSALAISKESNDIAREAREEARAARRDAEEARNTVREISRKYAALERAFDALWQWMNNIVTNWSTIRQLENPPALPPEAENHR